MAHISQKEFETIKWLPIKESFNQCIISLVLTKTYLVNQPEEVFSQKFKSCFEKFREISLWFCKVAGVKSDVHLPKKVGFVFFLFESPLKEIKNVFYFMLKALFVRQIFTFWFWPSGYQEKWLGKRIRLISKLMASQDG